MLTLYWHRHHHHRSSRHLKVCIFEIGKESNRLPLNNKINVGLPCRDGVGEGGGVVDDDPFPDGLLSTTATKEGSNASKTIVRDDKI
jgi:hypothetical protein